jgi:hypothetical protein
MEQWVGYLASVLVAVSITIKGGIYFRILNLAGSICFFVYGLLIKAWPVVGINVYSAGVNLFYIFREIGGKKNFTTNGQGQGED